MPVGDMPLFKRGVIKGEALLTTSLSSIDLCGMGSPKVGRIILDAPPIPRRDLRAAYLEVAAVVGDPRLARWKLWLDGFALTREFKPQVTVELDEGVFAKLMFDVTPVYRSEEGKHHVTITCSGTEPLSVKHIGLALLRHAEEAEQSYAYLSGAYALAPGEELELPVELEELEGRGWIHVVGVAPSKQASIRIMVNGSQRVMGGVAGADEIVARDVELGARNVLRVVHEKPSTPYYPRHFVLSTVMMGVEKLLEPRIIVEEAVLEDDAVHVRLSNQGASAPDSLLVVVLNAGVPVARSIVEPLSPGRKAEVTIPLRNNRGMSTGTLRVRAVYRKLSRTEFTDAPVSTEPSST